MWILCEAPFKPIRFHGKTILRYSFSQNQLGLGMNHAYLLSRNHVVQMFMNFYDIGLSKHQYCQYLL